MSAQVRKKRKIEKLFFNLYQVDHCTVERVFLPKNCGLPLLLFFWLKWAGYLAVAGLNLLAQISDRISPFGVKNIMPGEINT